MTTTTNKNFNNTIITKITGRQIGPFPVGKTAEFFKIDGRQIGRSANRSITKSQKQTCSSESDYISSPLIVAAYSVA